MTRRTMTLSVLLALGLTMFCAGGAHAAKTVTWGEWTVYNQEKSNWCWVAATKAIVKKASGDAVSQCQLFKDGKNVKTCTANEGGYKKDYIRALYLNGVIATPAASGHPTWNVLRSDTLAGKGVIQDINWTGTTINHAAPIIGTKAATKQIYIVHIRGAAVSASWVTYSQFEAGTAGLGSSFKPNKGWIGY